MQKVRCNDNKTSFNGTIIHHITVNNISLAYLPIIGIDSMKLENTVTAQ